MQLAAKTMQIILTENSDLRFDRYWQYDHSEMIRLQLL